MAEWEDKTYRFCVKLSTIARFYHWEGDSFISLSLQKGNHMFTAQEICELIGKKLRTQKKIILTEQETSYTGSITRPVNPLDPLLLVKRDWVKRKSAFRWMYRPADMEDEEIMVLQDMDNTPSILVKAAMKHR